MKVNKIKEAFSYIRAPEGVLREVNMKIEQEAKIHERPKRYGRLFPVAAILAAVLALSVAAYGFVHSDFYKNAFGTGVESYHSDILTGFSGSLVDRVSAALTGKTYSGDDITLTIDLKQQKNLEKTLENGKGAK